MGAGTLMSALVDFNPPAGGLDNVTDVDAGAVTGIAVTAADTANGTWFYSLDGGATWTALGTPIERLARLLAADADDRIYFRPNANFDGSPTSPSGPGTRPPAPTAASRTRRPAVARPPSRPATDTATLVVTPVNDAPVLISTATPVGTVVNEDPGAPVVAVGTLIPALVDSRPAAGGQRQRDRCEHGAVTGIAVTAADTANGTWFYSLDGGTTWTALGTPSNSCPPARGGCRQPDLFPARRQLRRTRTAITFRAWDRTSGTDGGTANTSTNGSTTAFSIVTDTATFDVTPVNDGDPNDYDELASAPPGTTIISGTTVYGSPTADTINGG